MTTHEIKLTKTDVSNLAEFFNAHKEEDMIISNFIWYPGQEHMEINLRTPTDMQIITLNKTDDSNYCGAW